MKGFERLRKVTNRMHARTNFWKEMPVFRMCSSFSLCAVFSLRPVSRMERRRTREREKERKKYRGSSCPTFAGPMSKRCPSAPAAATGEGPRLRSSVSFFSSPFTITNTIPFSTQPTPRLNHFRLPRYSKGGKELVKFKREN